MKLSQNSGRGTRIFQALVGVIFLAFGILHLFVPQLFIESMTSLGMVWMLPIAGVAELIGGLTLLAGLFIDNTRVSGIAALWNAATMVGAMLSHLRVGDFVGSLAPFSFLILPIILLYLHRQTVWHLLPSKQQT